MSLGVKVANLKTCRSCENLVSNTTSEERRGIMSFGQAIRSCLSKYSDFSGAATRSEYWFFSLFVALCYFGGILVSVVLKSFAPIVLIALGLILPGLACVCRRLRDGGFSPYLIFLSLIPYVGGIAILVLMFMPSKRPGYISPLFSQPAGFGASRFCSKCGFNLALGQQFCANCGSQI